MVRSSRLVFSWPSTSDAEMTENIENKSMIGMVYYKNIKHMLHLELGSAVPHLFAFISERIDSADQSMNFELDSSFFFRTWVNG